MKVYIITGVPFPKGMAPMNRIKCYAKAMEMQGIECEIVLYLQSNISLPKHKGIFEGVRYHFVGKEMHQKNRVLRLIEKTFDEIRLLRYLRRELKNGDVVISYGATVGFTPLVVKMVHKKNAKFVLELVELPYGTSAETPKMIANRKKVLKQFVSYDGVLAISQALNDLSKENVGPKAIVQTIPILVDYEKYSLPDRTSDVGVPFIFHSGSLYEQKDGFVGMIEAFGILMNTYRNPIKFISTGTLDKCPHEEQVKALIDKYHLQDKVVFTGYLDEGQLSDYLSKASLVIINKYVNQQNTYCFSTKLGEYMAAGKPVVITKVGEAINWLKDGYDARIIEPGNSILLADTIKELLEDNSKRKMIAENARLSCKEYFDYRSYGELFESFFKQLNS